MNAGLVDNVFFNTKFTKFTAQLTRCEEGKIVFETEKTKEQFCGGDSVQVRVEGVYEMATRVLDKNAA